MLYPKSYINFSYCKHTDAFTPITETNNFYQDFSKAQQFYMYVWVAS